MPNPFTRSLVPRLHDPSLAEFVRHWDALEALIIRVHRSGELLAEDEKEHRRVRGWLRRKYPPWRRPLEPLWRQTRIGGRPTRSDPFQALLRPASPSAFLDNWEAMQTLPAAREALNQLLMARLRQE